MKKLVLVAIPAYSGIDPFTSHALTEGLIYMREKYGDEVSVKPFLCNGESWVMRARNIITDYFMNSKVVDEGGPRHFDELVMIDADIGFTNQNLARLIQSPHLLTAGIYCKKNQTPNGKRVMDDSETYFNLNGYPVWNPLPGQREVDEEGYLPIRHGATGFMKIKRELCLQMQARWPTYYYRDYGRTLFHFWPGELAIDDNERILASEDWIFCQRTRELGHQVMLDTRIVLRHFGRAEFPLGLPTMANHE